MTTVEAALVEFLLARFAEDEAVAQRVRGTAFGSWRFVPDPDGRLGGYVAPGGAYASPVTAIANDWSGRQVGAGYVSVAEHIARHDPARVLAECEAKRRILNLLSGAEFALHCHPDDAGEQGHVLGISRAVAILALPYADHPDYRSEWKP